ncbi:MAG TPA: universal stress protein, partial [Thermoanaerobaculia bacterium]|nr:universal stress protein [Thermoanaerobaculia bacterium]
HLEAVLGAFVIGIVFGQLRRLPDEVHEKVESIALGIFAPVFFAVAGLKVDLRSLLEPRLLGLAVLIIVLTTLAKGAGVYLGARLIGRKDHWTALSFSAGLNTRGAMDIIIATIGLELNVFSQDMFSIVVLLAMTNALAAPTALRAILARVTPSEEELQRLRKEERAEESLVAGIHRVLLPIRLRDTTQMSYAIESKILERMALKSPIALTLLTVTKPGDRAEGQDFLERVSDIFSAEEMVRRVVVGSSPSELILDEAQKEYDLMVLGAAEESSLRVLFNPMVDYLVRVSPCPTMIIKSPPGLSGWEPNTILVPTKGTAAARQAAEIAFALATGEHDRVIALTVVRRDRHAVHIDADESHYRRQLGSATQIVRELKDLGATEHVHVDDEVRVGIDPESVILDFARVQKVDLIILGTSLRPGSQRLFLGPKVERILQHAPCPVIVFNTA